MNKILLGELWNKLIHILVLLALFVFYFIEKKLSTQAALLWMIALLIVFLALEYFRLDMEWKLPLFGEFVRPKEYHRFYGAVYFTIATIIALAVFDRAIALAAIFMAVFGDLAAAVIGKKYGTSLAFRNKTWAGCTAELIVNALIGFIILGGTHSVYVIIGMTLIATAAETIVQEMDESIIIVLGSGLIGQLIMFAF